MKKTTTIAAAFLALAGLAASAQADDGRRGDRQGPRSVAHFEAADADANGEVTFEEFAEAINKRLVDADADGDGKMTVGEIAAAIERMRAERMAQRMVERFDTDGDGALTKAEVDSRQKKMFALLDRNDDGKIVRDEMPRRGDGRKGRHHGWR
ncbi:MAG: acid-shock protein [Rhizobiaceae bacterium]|nr:MAG: acid-shock protein [Rhizobiaceae bacterium]CAG0993890.1 calmodulin [Rhizobiaceae bacterium]